MTQRYEEGALIRGTAAFNAVLRDALENFEIPIEHQDNIALACAFVEKSSAHIAIIHPGMRFNYDVVCTAVRKNGRAFGHVSDGYKADRGIALTAIRSYAKAFAWASQELRADRELALAAVKIHGSMYEHAAQDLRNDINFNVACARLNLDVSQVLLARGMPGFYSMICSRIAHIEMVAPLVVCIRDGTTMHCSEAITGESIMSFRVGAHMTYDDLATTCCKIMSVNHVHLIFGTDTICPSMVSRAIAL